MKKFLLVLFTLAIMLVMPKVSAMTKTQLQEKLTKTYTINGASFSVNEQQKILIERYLAKNDLSKEAIDTISNKIDEAVKIVENSGAKSVDELTKATKEELKNLILETSKETKIKVTISNGTIAIYNLDGTKFAEVTKTTVRYTDSFNYFMMLAGAISLIGVVAITLKVKKANA